MRLDIWIYGYIDGYNVRDYFDQIKLMNRETGHFFAIRKMTNVISRGRRATLC